MSKRQGRVPGTTVLLPHLLYQLPSHHLAGSPLEKSSLCQLVLLSVRLYLTDYDIDVHQKML